MKDNFELRHYRHRELPKEKRCKNCRSLTSNKEGYCDFCLFNAQQAEDRKIVNE